MGFHLCEYCEGKSRYAFLPTSSGDNKIETGDVIVWFPDMVLHYIADHSWQPPQFFIDIIMDHSAEIIAAKITQYLGMPPAGKKVEHIGYLSGQFPKGPVPEKFINRLKVVMEACKQNGNHVQSKCVISRS